MPKKLWTKEELMAAGILEENAIDSTTHPHASFSTWDVLERDAKALGDKAYHRYPHVRPESLLVAAIGNLWVPNAWWRLQDMCLHTSQAGYSVSIEEIADPNLFSSDAIAFTRWQASMLARDGGVQWLLMVDNDVLVEKDTFLRLVKWDMPIVFPLLVDLEERYPAELAPLSRPGPLEPGQGLVPVQWAAMSCMLFNPMVFNAMEPYAWRGTDYHFGQALNHVGHRIMVDTTTSVAITRGPTRLAQLEYDALWDAHRTLYGRLKHEERNRHAPPGFNPETDNGFVDKDGMYLAVPNSVAKQWRNEDGHPDQSSH